MQQQVNLYRFLPKPPQQVVSLDLMLRVLMLLIGLLALVSTCQIIAANRQDSQLEKLQKQLQTSNQKILVITLKNQESSNKKLQKEIDELTKALASKKQLAEQLNNIVANAPKLAYSAIFLELANTITPDVWLTQIHIADNGNLIELKGHSYKEAAFTHFVQRLESAPIFAGKAASSVQLQIADPASSLLNFNIKMQTQAKVLKP